MQRERTLLHNMLKGSSPGRGHTLALAQYLANQDGSKTAPPKKQIRVFFKMACIRVYGYFLTRTLKIRFPTSGMRVKSRMALSSSIFSWQQAACVKINGKKVPEELFVDTNVIDSSVDKAVSYHTVLFFLEGVFFLEGDRFLQGIPPPKKRYGAHMGK